MERKEHGTLDDTIFLTPGEVKELVIDRLRELGLVTPDDDVTYMAFFETHDLEIGLRKKKE